VKVRVSIAAFAMVAGAYFLPAAELPCASAESMDGLMQAWTAGFNARQPDNTARVTLRAKFSADFVEPLARGEVKVAAFAREWFPAELVRFTALAGGPPTLVPVATGSRATKGGTHAVVIFVHEKNPLARLALPQLREIFAAGGRLTTWGQLGLGGEWAARKISVHGMRTRRETGNPPGIVNFLEARLLAGRSWRDDLREYNDEPGGAQSLEQIVRAVAADEGAIGYSGFAYSAPGVKTLALSETEAGPFFAGTEAEIAGRQYPLVRTLYLAAGPAPDATTRAFIDHVLGPAGQGAVAEDAQGFFPLTAVPENPALSRYEPRPVTVPPGARYVTADGAVAVIGYNDMEEMLDTLGMRFSALHPGVRFAHNLQGTRTAPPALASGESAFAPMGAEFSPIQLAEYRAVAGSDPLPFRVAHCSLDPAALSGPLGIMVHRDNSLTALSLAEVADIFSGRSSRGLHPLGLAPDTALGLFLRDRVLAGEDFGQDFRGFRQSREVVQAVAADPQAIGFAAAMRTMPGVKVLALSPGPGRPPVALTEENLRAGRYPLDRFLLIYARQPLDPLVREYLRFVLSREGQEVIARGSLGYLPLNDAELAAEQAKLD
jgi:phosphate transport system substrate-binding protein